MPIQDFLDLMPDTISYESVIGRDEFGKAITFTTPVSYRCRITYLNTRVVSETLTPTIVASVAGYIPTINIDDRVTLPDGTTPEIIKWEHYPDDQGSYFTKITMGGLIIRSR